MKKDFLTSFVNDLSTSEKRYVSEYLALRNKKNKYSVLFNSIISSGKSDKKLPNREVKKGGGDYVAKNELTKKLFKLLRMYHSDTSREQTMKSICMDVEILYSKGCFLDCKKIIDSALIICKKNEWFELESYLLNWEEKVLVAMLNMDSLPKELNRNLKDALSTAENLMNLNYYKQLKFRR